MEPIESTIDIAAPPLRVWRILCDFNSYSKWNPYRTIVGEAVQGARVVLFIGPEPARRRKLRAGSPIFSPGKPWR